MPVSFSSAGLGLQQPNASPVREASRAASHRWRQRRRTSRRRPCYANSRLLQLPRFRWVRPRWRRPPPPPGAVWLARWLAWRLAWRLGRSALLRRRPRLLRLLRLRRLLCAATGPDPLGTALAAGQPLLLIRDRPISTSESPGRQRRGFSVSAVEPRPEAFIQFLLETAMQSGACGETISAADDLIAASSHRDGSKRNSS